MNALLLVPLTLIMAYYNWLSSFQWQSDSKPIVPSRAAPHFICQTFAFVGGKIQLTSLPENTVYDHQVPFAVEYTAENAQGEGLLPHKRIIITTMVIIMRDTRCG